MTMDTTTVSISESLLKIQPNEQKVLYDKIKSELSKFGLTANQSKVFLFLEKYGSSTATQVSNSLKVPRTETYHLLTNLQNRGIVSASFQHPTKFIASPLDTAIDILINAEKERVKSLEIKERDIVALWKTLPHFGINKEEVSDGKFQILQGLNQISGKISEVVSGAKRSILILATEKDLMKFYHAGLLELLNEPKVDIQLVSSSSSKTEYIFSDSLRNKVKRMPQKIKEDLCFIIKDDDEVILFIKKTSETSQNMLAMWTNSYSMTYTLKLLFGYIWSNSRYFKSKKEK
jgi:HTH-type transcriptional regulator, sugar sensing transcriptional regulator